MVVLAACFFSFSAAAVDQGIEAELTKHHESYAMSWQVHLNNTATALGKSNL